LPASGWNDGGRNEYGDGETAGKSGAARHYAGPDKKLAQHAAVAEVLGGKNLLSATAPTVARGANENTNGLLRKYCPNDEYIEKAV